MNRLHPIFHSYSYQAGSRVDVEEILPLSLDDEDCELLIDNLSEPPTYIERIAPLSITVGTETVKGKNWTDLMLKGYRILNQIFHTITIHVKQSIIDNFKEKGMAPISSITIDPTTLTQILEMDFETGDNVYSQFMKHYSTSVISTCATTPFHILLPLLDDDFDIELLARTGFKFYWNMLVEHHKNIKKTHNENKFLVVFWLPEGAYSKRVAKIIYDVFMDICQKEKVQDPHLAFLLDNQQIEERENDMVMKSWNTLSLSDDKTQNVSVLFKDRSFSDWVTLSNPSVKKLLDRTIAKVDSDLNDLNVNYCWSHFEEIENIMRSHKAAKNYEQKIIKLIELGYLPTAPDFFIRRKMGKKFGKSPFEPVKVEIKDNTSWSDWHINNISLGRWTGNLDSNAEYKLVDENRAYARYAAAEGKIDEIGPQCWKIAYNEAVKRCVKLVKGDPNSLKGGVIEILASLVPSKDQKIVKQNVMDFLIKYALIYWKEHFLQQKFGEADIYLPEIANSTLLKGTKTKSLKEKDYIISGTAAQVYYFILEGLKSTATNYENFDQRGVYQNIMHITLAISRLIALNIWLEKTDKVKKLIECLKEELIGFDNAYERYNLAEYGVTKDEWKEAVKSVVDDSKLNVVSRAARRTAARHLRPLGFRKDFSIDDENISTNTGHLWNEEVENVNFRWDNKFFYGIKEE